MGFKTATNPDTGERVVLVGNRWEPFTQSATNDKGDKAYLVNNKWVIDELAAEAEPAAAPTPTPPAAAPPAAAPTTATPATRTTAAAPPAAAPKTVAPKAPAPAPVAAAKYKSVLETVLDPVAQQAEIDKRLSYGVGPISKETAAKADLVRSGMATTDDARVNRIAQEMAKRKQESFGGLIARAKSQDEAEQETPDRTLSGTALDIGVTALKGMIGLPEAFVGLADIPSLGRAGKALEDIGYKPAEAKKILDTYLSEAQQAANRKVQKTKGFFPTIQASLENPSTIATAVGESIPQMLGGAGVGRALVTAAPKVAPWLAAAVGEGVLGAGSAAEQTRAGTQDKLLTGKQAASAVGSGVGTAIFGAVGGRLANRLGIDDVETMLVAGASRGGPVKSVTDFAKRAVGSGISEGVFEEMPQSAQEKMWSNYATDRPLMEGVPEASAQGLTTGFAMGLAGGSYGAASQKSPEQLIADAINANVADTQFTGTDQAARTLLSADTYDARLISPMMTSDPSRVLQSTSVDEAVTSANDLAGSLEITPGPIEPTFDANAPTGALGPSGPTLGPNGLVDAGPSGPTLDLSTPTVPGPDGPSFDGNVPDALLGPSGPTLDTLAPAGAVPPTLPRLAERTSDSDLLARVTGQVPELGALTAPRPQKIQGVAVSQLSDGQLETITADENVPAITRRGASIELTARQTEAAGTTPATGLANAPSVTLPDAAATQDTGSIADKTLTLPATPMRGVPPTSMGGVADGDAARAAATESLGRWATSTNQVSLPAVFNAPTPEAATAVAEIAEALGTQFKGRLFAYNDNREGALNGIAIGRVAFVNTGSVDVNIGRTALHEFHHTVEQIAKLETKQGLTNTPAQRYVASMNGIFAGMDDAGKRAYLTNFLNKDELAKIADPVAREQRLQELVASPVTESEMVADFLGNRATDKRFWKDVAKADPQGFKAFVDKWIGIIDNLLAVFQGKANQGKKESARVDKYVQDLKAAKVIARDALVEYSKGVRDGSTSIATGEGVSELAASARPVSSGDGGGQAPEYGTARKGAISVLGRHYSAETRSSLSGAFYGSGLKGAERDRLDGSPDPRLKNRIYFYVDQGSGIRPESGVGGIAHEVQLNNIYDPKTQLLPVKGNFNAFESSVINSGFDGYIAPFGNNQSAVVLLGPRHLAVPVRPLGRVAGAPAPVTAEPTTLKKGLLSKELEAIEATRVPGARLRNGNLEIPATSRDAANAEMERIGSDVRFSTKQKVAPARVMFEVAPDPDNLDLMARWEAVPFERKIVISQKVAEKIMPQVFRLAGVRAKLTTQLGGFLENTSPSFAAVLPSTASAEQLMDVARLGGFGLSQQEMMVLDSKPFKGSSLTGLITVTLPENMVDQESVQEVYLAVRQVSPENIRGHTTVGREMVLAVPSDSMADLTSKVAAVLSARPEPFAIDSKEGQSAFVKNTEYDYDNQTGNQSPELLAKRAEARRIREEASAAIEAELAKDESTGGRKIDTGVYRSVADAFGLSQAEYNASALPMMLGGVEGKTFRAPKIGGIPETIQWLDQRYQDSGMPVLDINKAEDRATLAKLMAAEAVGAIRSAGNSVEWYDETIDKMLSIMAVKYPELNTDPDARNAFLIAVAISSQTMNVEANLTFASSQYEGFRTTGKFPEVGKGKSEPAMIKNFILANEVMADMGPDLLLRFLRTEFTKRELESIGYPIGSESMDEKMLGSAIFGPKIGFGFYSNLSGNFEPITMDMWFMRFVGRLSGTLLAFDPVLFPKQVAKLRAALDETGDSSRGVYASDFKPEEVAAAQKSDAGAVALARKVLSLHNRQFKKEREAFDSGARIKTALVGASNGIIKSSDKPTDSPASGGERQRLRDVTRQMVALVEKQTGNRVPPAALQALVWYPEQELYKKLGVDLAVTSQDYAGAAKLLLTKEGFDEKRIDTAAESGPRQARQVAGKSDARTNKQAGQPDRPTGPLKGTERETFIATRVPLKDIFAGLEKRGLAKTKTEGLVNRRPDAAGIRYIQDNFLDILDELDTTGKVEINCK